MSQAQVQFADRYRHPALPGKELHFSFLCPRHPHRCGRLLIAGREPPDSPMSKWDWDGNRDSPSFVQAIDCFGCWRGFIENNRCVDIKHQDEPELFA